MRKTIIMAVLALLSSSAVCAQERMSAEDRAASMTERINNASKRMAKEFELKDDALEAFTKIYGEYQREMFSTNESRGQKIDLPAREGDKKELSDEEANAKIKENFERQEQQITTMQKRLEIQKKYAEEFAKVLTPQQILKVLTPQRGQGNGREQLQRRGDGERRGNFEGGNRGGFGGGPRGGGFGGPGGGF